MKSIEDLIIYFGKYLSNPEFEKFREKNLMNPTKYNSLDLFIRCKDSKMELCFTNERDLRESDAEKPLKGGKPIFTHFFIYPATEKNFEKLPFAVTFKDSLKEIEDKCGMPNDSKRRHDKIFGNITEFINTARPANINKGIIIAKASLRDLRWTCAPNFMAASVNLSMKLLLLFSVIFCLL